MLFVDFDKSLPEAGPIAARVGEAGRVVSATVLDMGEPVDLTGSSARFVAPYGESAVESPCSVEGCVASWPMPRFSEPGRFFGYVEISKGETVATTHDIAVAVSEGAA